MAQFKPGDEVEHKSSDRRLVVKGDGKQPGTVVCEWLDDKGDVKTHEFLESALRPAQKGYA